MVLAMALSLFILPYHLYARFSLMILQQDSGIKNKVALQKNDFVFYG